MANICKKSESDLDSSSNEFQILVTTSIKIEETEISVENSKNGAESEANPEKSESSETSKVKKSGNSAEKSAKNPAKHHEVKNSKNGAKNGAKKGAKKGGKTKNLAKKPKNLQKRKSLRIESAKKPSKFQVRYAPTAIKVENDRAVKKSSIKKLAFHLFSMNNGIKVLKNLPGTGKVSILTFFDREWRSVSGS